MGIDFGRDNPPPKNISDARIALTCTTSKELRAKIPNTVLLFGAGHADPLYVEGIIDDDHVYYVQDENYLWGGVDMATIFEKEWLSIPESAQSFLYWLHQELRQVDTNIDLEHIQLYSERNALPKTIEGLKQRAKDNFAKYVHQAELIDAFLSDPKFTELGLGKLRDERGSPWQEILEKIIAQSLGQKDDKTGERKSINIGEEIEGAIQRGVSARTEK